MTGCSINTQTQYHLVSYRQASGKTRAFDAEKLYQTFHTVAFGTCDYKIRRGFTGA